jgi:hypothetical protein
MRKTLLAASVLLSASTAFAGGFEDSNPSTFARAAALPSLGRGAVLEAGETEARAALVWSNEFFYRGNSNEFLVLDAETQRLGLTVRRGFGKGLEASLELPFINSGGGSLDNLIEGWHSAFGLPNSNRSDRPRDQYRIRYVRNGQDVLLRTQGSSGIGDVRLAAGWALTPALTLRGMLQLPTGDADTLTGGHTGGALWGEYTQAFSDSGRANVVLSAGITAATSNGALGPQQQPVIGVLGAALTVPVIGGLDALLELNANNKLYQDSGQAPLSHAAAVLQLGGRYTAGTHRFELGVIEDASVNASPDFGLHFGYSLRWR